MNARDRKFNDGDLVTIVNFSKKEQDSGILLKEDHNYRVFNHPFLEVVDETRKYLYVKNPDDGRTKSMYKWRFQLSFIRPDWEV